MFTRIMMSGKNQYLQIVENRKVGGKVVQRVISTLGRLHRMQGKGEIETLVRSLSRSCEKVLPAFRKEARSVATMRFETPPGRQARVNWGQC